MTLEGLGEGITKKNGVNRRAGDVAQLVKYLPSMLEVVS